MNSQTKKINGNVVRRIRKSIALFTKIRQGLESTDTAGCQLLRDVNEKALASNAECLRLLNDRLSLVLRGE